MEFTKVIYIHKIKSRKRDHRLFVKFLWSVLVIDLLGNYAGLAYFDNYELFGFLEGTPFVRNIWYYNIVEVYFIGFYTYILRRQLSGPKIKNLIKWFAFIYVFLAVLNMFFFGNLFEGDLILNDMAGAFLIVLSVFAYFYEMMLSDKVLSFYKSLFFYVAIGVSISYLTIIPINIYDDFITQQNEVFLEVFYTVVRYANIFMYSMFTLGFIMDYRYRRSESANIETNQYNEIIS
ncbi:MAG: hypothetical protein R3250_05330 [Melioribacteraceae bacterium]|nr:hypothetical protein [Melioribacteraceae bacterium]